MTIKQAITLRIARFDLLWLKSVGYTFQDEPEVEQKRYEKEMAEWQPKADEAARKYGFTKFDDYPNSIDYEADPGEQGRIEELQEIWNAEPKEPNALINYEMNVIDEAERIAYFIQDKAKEKGLTNKEVWDSYAKKGEEYASCWDFVKNIQADGYDGWDEGHSGNSGSASVRFASTLLFNIELFPYMHGALTPLVGDKGYHDDRSDVKEYIEKFGKNEN
jgi:hypothetical protein